MDVVGGGDPVAIHTRTSHLRSDWSVALIYSSQVDAEDQKTYKCHKFWQRNTLFILSTGPYFGWEILRPNHK